MAGEGTEERIRVEQGLRCMDTGPVRELHQRGRDSQRDSGVRRNRLGGLPPVWPQTILTPWSTE